VSQAYAQARTPAAFKSAIIGHVTIMFTHAPTDARKQEWCAWAVQALAEEGSA
jgi:hypothetical protein